MSDKKIAYVDPLTKEQLLVEEAKVKRQTSTDYFYTNRKGYKYPVFDGIPDLTYPYSLKANDQEFNDKYDANAEEYDKGMDWLFNSFYEKEQNVRQDLVSHLELQPGQLVLNLGCGTGSDSVYISDKISKKGYIVNLDLTLNLLRIAKDKLGDKTNMEFVRGNASYLPFADNTFDSVFHFGGINMFSEKKKAIEEMTRVVKPDGRVVFGDESAAPWLKNKKFGKIIRNANPLYNHTPPLSLLPINAQKVSLSYLLGNSFYIISFNKGEPVRLNLDLEIPGKRGGTLRTRYQNSLRDKK